MGVKVEISDFDSVDNSSFITELNNMKDEVTDEFDNVVYRDGSFSMLGSLDMNSNRIYNLPEPISATEPLRLIDAANLSGIEQPQFTFSVVDVAAGGDATIDVTGTYPNLNIEFGVVQGDQGVSGALSDGTFSGITVSGGGANLDVVAGHITLARMAQLPANTLIGNDSGVSATPQALTVGELQTMLGFSALASLASPVFTGNPTAPTPATSDNDTSVATTAFVNNLLASSLTRTIPVMSGAMTSRTSNGAAAATVETTTNKVNYRVLDFDASSIEYAQFMIPMPKSWDEGTVTVQFLWRVASGTGSVVWAARAVAISDDDLADVAFGTAGSVTDAVTATTDVMISSFTSAITIAGSPAAEDLVCFEVYRDATNGSDTLTTDARLIGIRIKYTTHAKDDA
jgi:hypothetical protein